jgi:oligopeptide/dipeptide ABC transporter ATP-binding protein
MPGSASDDRDAPLLEVRDLEVMFVTARGKLEAIRGVDLAVGSGETLGLVGESGCGKSVTMLAVMGLLPPHVQVKGSIRFRGAELAGRPQKELAKLRGARIGMIFQDPMTALNPVLAIGAQIAEAIRIHDAAISAKKASERAVEMLKLVAIPFPERRALQYPHELSGGMRQRAMIAMAMANEPDLLIADEPTTALDVTVQAQIIELLRRLQASHRMGLVLISHDLGIVAGTADRVAIMYAGRIVERGAVEDIFDRPRHPNTRGLLASLPKIDNQTTRLTAIDGAPPSLAARPTGCAFHPRCRHAIERCAAEEPALRDLTGVAVACHLAESIADDPLAPMTADGLSPHPNATA